MSRRGFTLIELLVVVTIVAVLVGLLLSGVQKVRAAAARTACTNNLKQQSLAVHQYGDARGAWPAGCSYQNGKSPYPFVSWAARVLPYLEQTAVWDRLTAAYATDPDFRSNAHNTYSGVPLAVFGCPTDARTPGPSTKVGDANWPIALSAYLGVNGTNYLTYDGVLYLDSGVRPADIRDGTSNTLLIGERPPSTDEQFGWIYFGSGQADSGSADMTLGVREMNVWHETRYCYRGPYFFSRGVTDNTCDMFHFWSLHAGGGNFAFADGSVRFLTYPADGVMPALATRAGGETVAGPD